jgi:hypothetical protein
MSARALRQKSGHLRCNARHAEFTFRRTASRAQSRLFDSIERSVTRRAPDAIRGVLIPAYDLAIQSDKIVASTISNHF